MPGFGDNLFSGAAYYYLKYRPAYPEILFKDIVKYFGLNGQGRLLDLGCGTGEVAIPLATYFENVLAIDPNSQMLAYGRQKAKAKGVGNIKWQRGSSNDLTGVYRGLKLITMGQSFHWMDQKPTLKKLYELLDTGGGIVIVSGRPTAQNERAAKKDQIIKQTISKYLGPARRAGNGTYEPGGLDWEKDLFAAPPFGHFQKRQYVIQKRRNIDQIIGQLYSKSWALRNHFGAQILDFENEIRAKLSGSLGSRDVIEKHCFDVYYLVKK